MADEARERLACFEKGARVAMELERLEAAIDVIERDLRSGPDQASLRVAPEVRKADQQRYTNQLHFTNETIEATTDCDPGGVVLWRSHWQNALRRGLYDNPISLDETGGHRDLVMAVRNEFERHIKIAMPVGGEPLTRTFEEKWNHLPGDQRREILKRAGLDSPYELSEIGDASWRNISMSNQSKIIRAHSEHLT